MNNIRFIFKITIKFFRLFLKTFLIILTFIPKLIKTLLHTINKRLRFSISFKMTAVYTLIFSITLFVLSISLIIGFRFFLINEAQNELAKYNTVSTSYVKLDNGTKSFKNNIFANIKYVTLNVFDENETLVYSSQKDKNNISFHKETTTNSVINEFNQQLVFVTSKLELNNKIFFFQFSKDLNKENIYLAIFTVIIFIVNIFSLIITLGFGSRASKKMLLPIKHMTKTIRAISINVLEKRINVSTSHDELKQLAETFNEMLDRLQTSYEMQNQFVSDASHELRTPIAVIQGYANLLYRWGKDDKEVLAESITAIKSESYNMQQLVEKLLFLARSDKKTQKIYKEYFCANELINELIKETKLIDSNHQISSDLNEKLSIYADKNLLKQALRIFIDNSIKYTPIGGTIKLNSYIKKSSLTIEIIDTGIGIAKNDLPHIFTRFYRCDKSRSKESGGTGLGLSISKWIISKHNGSILVESKPEMGTKITIGLPLGKK